LKERGGEEFGAGRACFYRKKRGGSLSEGEDHKSTHALKKGGRGEVRPMQAFLILRGKKRF